MLALIFSDTLAVQSHESWFAKAAPLTFLLAGTARERTRLHALIATFREELVRTVTPVAFLLLHTVSIDSHKSWLTEASLLALSAAFFSICRAGLATLASTLGEEFVLSVALFALIVLDTFSVDAHESGLAEAALFTSLLIALFTRQLTRLRAAASTVRELFVLIVTLVAMIVSHALATNPHKSFLAETSSLAGTRAAVPLATVTLFIARSATGLEDLMSATLFVALPLGHTLSTDPNEAIFAEAPLLARFRGAATIVRTALFVASLAALFKLLI